MIGSSHSGGYEDFLLAICFMLVLLLSLFFDPEDGDDMFLRNVR
jgi:hypothetical protein